MSLPSFQDSSECIEPPNNPYGPYPCKAFTKVVAFKAKDEENDEEVSGSCFAISIFLRSRLVFGLLFSSG